jgi:hypothetical protein
MTKLTSRRDRRLAILVVAPDFLIDALTDCRESKFLTVRDSPLPADAKARWGWHDNSDGNFRIVIESKSFQPVPEGAEIPIIDSPEIGIIYGR